MTKLGTAKITDRESPQGRYVEVRYMNGGSSLRCEPRCFHNRNEAFEFCREYQLRVVS